MSGRRFVALAVVGVVGFAFGLWWSRHTATPDVVEGWAMPHAVGNTISLHDSDDTRVGNSYIIAGAWWAGPDGVWRDGSLPEATCVGTDPSSKIRVQLGIVDVEDGGEGIGGSRVVWLRCLE